MGRERSREEADDFSALMTTDGAAEYLGISAKTLANWRSAGTGPPFIKVGGRVAYRPAGLVSWTHHQEIGALRREGLSKVKITIRPYKKDPTRQHVDIMFPHPHKATEIYRRRIVAPSGMDLAAARTWGEKQARDILRELSRSTSPREESEETSPRPSKAKAIPVQAAIPTLREFWPRFEAEYIQTLKRASQLNYESVFRLHLAPIVGDLPLDLVGRAEVSQLKAACRKKGHSPTMVNFVGMKLTTMIRIAAQWGVVGDSDVPRITKEKRPRRHVEVVSRADMNRMADLAAAKSIRHEALILLLTRGALRIGEAVGLMWTDIDWSRGVMVICRNVVGDLVQDSPKGEIGEVPLSRPLLSALTRLQAESAGKGPFVLARLRSGRWSHSTRKAETKRVNALEKAVGIGERGPHLLRHSTLTDLARSGVSPYALQALARHGRMATTMQYYVHLNKVELATQAVSLLDGATSRSGNSLATEGNPSQFAH